MGNGGLQTIYFPEVTLLEFMSAFASSPALLV